MDTITTTNLRTQSSKLIHSLKQGKIISLVHRSQIVGEISPVKPQAKPFDVKRFRELIKKSPSNAKLTYEERDKLYRKQLEEKYGKDLS